MKMEKLSESLSFLDIQFTYESNGSLSICRKSIHTGRLLPFNSHHTFSQKLSLLELCTLRAEKNH